MKVIAEYIWLDGKKPLAEVRGKTKVMDVPDDSTLESLMAKPSLMPESTPEVIPEWGFDGSSTEQGVGIDSDRVLKPVKVYPNPFRAKTTDYPSVIVLNEVYFPPGDKPHDTNGRAELVKVAEAFTDEQFWIGIEQEYTLLDAQSKAPIGFSFGRENMDPQGKYYCGVGADRIFGRTIAEEHLIASLDAGLIIAGINAEVMPGQWEYQIGNGTALSDPLRVADDLIVARYIMGRIGEKHGVIASLDPKPAPGWNGAGAHVNVSTESMRESDAGFQEILERLGAKHEEHIAIYGHGIEKRLIGGYETADYREFSSGVSNRNASIRIPWQVARDKKGYIEDRRPCANIDPYIVLAKIMKTVMG